MLVIREVLHCKPGKVRPLIEKFQALNTLVDRMGMPPMRLLTDFAGERYWTLVAEMEVESVDEFDRLLQGTGQSEADMQEMGRIMDGYHDLVEDGRREILKIEA